jgi:hydroxymethylbilane synthase
VVSLRGNVDTRLRKLESEQLGAIILATAGLKRLGFENRITQIISSKHVLPAIGQGALGLEVRRDDEQTIGLIEFLNHEPTEVAVKAERAFLKKLEGGCQVPIAGIATLEGDAVHFTGMVAELDGTRLIKNDITGSKNQAEELGITLAETLLDDGAGEILERIYGAL